MHYQKQKIKAEVSKVRDRVSRYHSNNKKSDKTLKIKVMRPQIVELPNIRLDIF